MTMGNMGLSCTLAPTYGWTSKSQSHSSFVFNKKRNGAIVKHKPQTYVAEPTFPEHIKMRHTTKMRPTIVKKHFRFGLLLASVTCCKEGNTRGWC